MPQSLTKIYVHIIFSTKHRMPVLFTPIKEELWAYLGEICRQHECEPVCIGGYTDHVHILCQLSRKIALMKLVEVVKAHSSKWIKTRGKELEGFYWQAGYGAFSVGQAQLGVVRKYIEQQDVHHQEKNFQEEFKSFLKRYEVEWDEQYVWD